jgi:putative glutamine amidotransferase
MTLVAVTQRVSVCQQTQERRDALDQNWTRLLQNSGVTPLLIPNTLQDPVDFFETSGARGLLLTGGNDLVSLGGNAPERDNLEMQLIAHARDNDLPILGVCRGMQLIQKVFGVKLEAVMGHVTPNQIISVHGMERSVNSYHNFGSKETVPDLVVWARALDTTIKAVEHRSENIKGLMWHPERLHPFHSEDLDYIRRAFAS